MNNVITLKNVKHIIYYLLFFIMIIELRIKVNNIIVYIIIDFLIFYIICILSPRPAM